MKSFMPLLIFCFCFLDLCGKNVEEGCQFAKSENFVLSLTITDWIICESQDPLETCINETYTFDYTNGVTAYAYMYWENATIPCFPLQFRFEWYDPSGTLDWTWESNQINGTWGEVWSSFIFPDFIGTWNVKYYYSIQGGSYVYVGERDITLNCPHPDRDALIEFYEVTNGDNWTNSWDTTGCDVCTWYGVNCINDRVTEVVLNNNNLSGTLPSELSTLSELVSLELNENQLTGSLPSEWSALDKLEVLTMYINLLTGDLPTSWANMNAIQYIELDNNQLTGSLPDEWGNISTLLGVDLYTNNLSGTLPSSWGNLTNLQELYIFENDFSGCIPSEWMIFCGLGFSTNYGAAGYNLTGNLLLPWEGDFTQFCATSGAEAEQYGANCDDSNALTNGETIQSDCSCLFVPNTNDDCANAIQLTPLPSVGNQQEYGTYDNLTASADTAPSCFTTDPNVTDGVWFELNGDGGIYDIFITDCLAGVAMPLNAQLGIYEGSCGGLTEVSCEESAGNTASTLSTSNGTTYYLLVDGLSGNTGEFCVDITNVDPCAPPYVSGDGTTAYVTNTNNSGIGSLRQALTCANNNSSLDLIEFNIPGAGSHTISLLSSLSITDAGVVIDASTQSGEVILDASGYVGTTLWVSGGGAAVYGLTINGTNGFGAWAMFINDPNCTIGALGKGNIINDFETGIMSTSPFTTIQNNEIGTTAPTSGGWGILMGADNMTIQNNVVGNCDGVSVSGNNIQVLNNFIGTDATNTASYPINSNGIAASTGNSMVISGNIIANVTGRGIEASIDGLSIINNTIRNNSGSGVRVHDGYSGVSISQNSFYCNSNGITLQTGANNNIASPIITTNTTSDISGTADINSTIEIYIHDETGCAGIINTQGKILLGTANSDGSGNWSLPSANFQTTINVGDEVTAITIDGTGNTSEFSSSAVIAAPCSHPDKVALIDLYEATNGSGWNITWDTTSCDVCNWYGVNCDGNNRVICIDLDGSATPCDGAHGGSNGLSGTIPDLDLPFIEKLYLGWNNITGDILNYSGMPNLEELHLWQTNLSGTIPNFTNLPNLKVFVTGWNNISGTIPEFTNLPLLENFTCSKTNLSGSIRDFQFCPNLKFYGVRENTQMTGEIPDFQNLPNLEGFWCWGNQNLTGNIPDFMNCLNLVEISCYNNQLDGSIPDLSHLILLEELYCQDNQLSGCFPDFVCNLFEFDASNNIGLSWGGDHTNFCTGGQSQTGATCDDGNSGTIGEEITCTCECAIPVATFTADISGTTTICPNTSTSLTFTFSGGNPPYTVDFQESSTGSTLVFSGNSGDTFTVNPTNTSTYQVLNATDTNGCTGNIGTTATITVEDNTDPQITCPLDQTISADATCQGIVPDLVSGSTASDNCGSVTVSQNPVSGSTFGGSHLSSESVTVTADDGNGNSAFCVVTLTLIDDTAPNPNCATGLVYELTGSPATVTISASDLNNNSTDNCDATLEYSFSNDVNNSNQIFTCNDLGNQTVQLWITDDAGNQSSCSTDITIEDNNCNCNIGTTITVTNTNDSGPGSLRQAITCANADPNLDNIEFNISGGGPHTISLLSSLTITDANVVIDGSTQVGEIILNSSGYSGTTLFVSGEAAEIYGLTITGTNGFGDWAILVDEPNCIIGELGKGNVINDFIMGILCNTNASACTIQYNEIGTTAPTTGGWGLNIAGDNSIVQNNIIGNSDGLSIDGTSVQVLNNYIGTDVSGTANYPIDGAGIWVYDDATISGNTVANVTGIGIRILTSNASISGNTITNNSGNAIRVDASDSQNVISQNSIYCNGTGILLMTNANNNIVEPNITISTTIEITGSAPSNSTIEIFIHDTNGCSGTPPCQGKTYLGSTTTDALGNWTFDPTGQVNIGDEITATATDTNNNTSEFSTCATVVSPCPNYTANLSGSTTICPNTSTDIGFSFTDGTAPWTVNWTNGSFTTSNNPHFITVTPPNTTTYSITSVTDNENCNATIGTSATITVEDTTDPVANCNTSGLIYFISGTSASVTASDLDNGSTDNCATSLLFSFSSNVNDTQRIFNCDDLGDQPVQLWVTDEVGNQDFCATFVTIQDNTAPVANCQDLTIELDATGNASITPTQVNFGSTDNCDNNLDFNLSQTNFACGDVGVQIVTLTATDDSGNQGDCDADIMVENGLPDVNTISATINNICVNDDATVFLTNVSPDGTWTFTYNLSGANTQASSNQILNISGGSGNFIIDAGSLQNAGTTTFNLTAVSNGTCTNTGNTSSNFQVNESPSFANLNETCNGNGTYTVTFNLNGTAPFTNNNGGGNISGNSFTSNPVNSGDNYNFEISDAAGCQSIFVSGSENCGCETMAGSMNFTPIQICESDIATAIHNNDASLFGNDLLQFVIHDNAGTSLGTNYWVANTPSFGLQNGMLTDVTYYISAIAGDDDGTGNIDLNDPCFDVSAGVEIIFYSEPTATLSGNEIICENEIANLTISLSGNPPFVIDYSINNNPQTSITTSDLNYNLEISPAIGSNSITLNSVSDAFCNLGNVSGSASVFVNAQPTATLSGGGTICENSGEIINLNIDLTGTPNWTINWTIDNIPQPVLNISNSPFIVEINESQAGTIEITDITGGNGCTNMGDGSTALVTVATSPTVDLGADQTFCPNPPITLNAGNLGATFNWNTGESTQTIQPNSSGTYSVTVTENNCSATDVIQLLPDTEPPTVTCPPDITVTTVSGNTSIVVNNIAPIADDNCSVETIEYNLMGITSGNGINDASGTEFSVGLTMVEYVVTDDLGLQNSCDFEVTVELGILSCREADSLSLVAFYNAMNGGNWDTGWNWNLNLPMTDWPGVELDAEGCVFCLDLDGDDDCAFEIIGVTSQFGGIGLSGQLPSEIGDLSNLEVLSLEADNIFGNIPPEVGQLTSLQYLNISFTNVSADLPIEFTQLNQLISIALIDNNLNGEIPNLTNFPNLQYAHFGLNEFTGDIPVLNTALLDFNCDSNLLTGNIPVFTNNNSSLEGFDCSRNNLTGEIPDLNVLPNLIQFLCWDNNLENGIPNLSNNLNLVLVSCGHNNLTGEIPSLSNNSLLEGFYCHDNQLTGSIPDLSNNPNLTIFLCYQNNLDDIVPLIPSGGKEYYFYENQFTFEDILPNFAANEAIINGNAQTANDLLLYEPQDSVYTDTTITVTEGEPLTVNLGFDENEVDNVYQWYHNGIPLTPVTGVNKLEFPSIQTNHAGNYWVHITNLGAPDLTLESFNIAINVEPSIQDCTVTNTNDSGIGSLRNAIDCANADPNFDNIIFNIPDNGPHEIILESPLFLNDDGIIIDATTQPNWEAGNVILNGSLLGNNANSILEIGSNDAQILGLYFKDFLTTAIYLYGLNFQIGDNGKENIFTCEPNNSQEGIIIFSTASGSVVNNKFGTTPDGMSVLGTFNYAIGAGDGGGNPVLIQGNTFGGSTADTFSAGIYLGNDGYTISENNFGTDESETAILTNTRGIFVPDGVQNGLIQNNVFANSTNWGIGLNALTQEIQITQNSFYCNDLDGIRIAPGANNNAQPPIITNAFEDEISGNSMGSFSTIELFINESTDCQNAACQGKFYLGTTTTDADGNWILNSTDFQTNINIGEEITATFTDTNNNTSEFSECQAIEIQVIPCNISNLSATPSACTNTEFSVEINFTSSGTSDTFNLTQNGNNLGNFLYADLPITVGPFAGNGQNIDFEITDSQNANCSETLSITAPECTPTSPENDDCIGLIDLGIAPYCETTIFNNVGATATDIGFDNSPLCWNNAPPERDVWFSFIVPLGVDSFQLDISLLGVEDEANNISSIINPEIALYRGDCEFDGMQEINCATSDDGATQVSFTTHILTPGITYFLRVQDWSNDAPNWGAFTFCCESTFVLPFCDLTCPESIDIPLTTEFITPDLITNEDLNAICPGVNFELEILDDLEQTVAGPNDTIFNNCDFIATALTINVFDDISGASCTSNLSIIDDISPEITCPLDTLIETGAGTLDLEVFNIDPTFDDNCTANLSYNLTNATTGNGTETASGQTFELGTTLVEYTVTDLSGNTNTCTFNVILDPLPSLKLKSICGMVPEGENITIHVTVEDFTDLTNSIFGFQFETADLEFIEFTNLNTDLSLTNTNFNISNINDGLIIFNWEDDNGASLPNGDTLFCITFKAIGNNGTLSEIAFDDPFSATHVNGEFIGTNSSNCSIEIEEPPAPQDTLSVFLESGLANFNDQICLDITAQNFEDITILGFDLDIDFSVLDFNSIIDGALDPIPEVEGDSLVLFWFDLNGLSIPDNELLFQICFDVIGDPCTNTDLLFDEELFMVSSNTNDYQVFNLQDATVDIDNNLITQLNTEPTTCELENGTATLILNGGTGNPSINWSTGEQNVLIVENLAADSYFVIIQDGECLDTLNFDIAPSINPLLVNLGNDTLICIGNSITLDAENDDCPTCIYSWSDDATITDPTRTILPTELTIISVTVTDENDCFVTDEILINVLDKPANPIIMGAMEVCEGDTEIYTISNFDASLDYSWQAPQNVIVTLNNEIATLEFSGAMSGDFCLMVTNTCGESENICLPIIVETPPIQPILESGETTVCQNESITYCIENIDNANSYIWNLPTGEITNTQVCQTILWETTGNQSFSVTAQNECGNSETLEITVTILELPTAALFNENTILCTGSPYELIIEFTGTPPFNLTYSNGSQNFEITNVTDNPLYLPFTATQNETYSLVSFSDANCNGSVSGTANISVEDVLINNINEIICEGEVYTFNNEILTETGIYQDTFNTINGCDSIVSLNLTIEPTLEIITENDDFSFADENDILSLDITENDILPDGGWSISLPNLTTIAGNITLEDDNIIDYQLDQSDFIGIDSFQYIICQNSCPDNCDTAIVRLNFDEPCFREAEENIPTGIRPNGDGQNDLFDPLAEFDALGCPLEESSVELMIVNRWGEVVFKSKPYPKGGWDGRNGNDGGKILPQGTYYYVLEIPFSDGTKTIKGTIHLLK